MKSPSTKLAGRREKGSSDRSKEVPSKPPDGWTRCHAFVERKHRFCRQAVTNPSEKLGGPRYCGNHSHFYKNPPKRKRVPCPIDGSHSIYEDDVAKHVKICPRVKQRRMQEQQPYYRHNINTGGCGGITEDAETVQVSVERAKRLALRILQAYQRVFSPSKIATSQSLTFEQIQSAIPLLDLSKPELEAGLPESVEYHRFRSGGPRHLIQQASLIGHLRRVGALPSLDKDSKKAPLRKFGKTCLLEMGAGRGMFGLLAAGAAAGAAEALQASPNLHLVLVERAGTRFKADSVLRLAKGPSADKSLNYLRLHQLPWTRIQCDLAHVHMPTVLADLQPRMETGTESDSCAVTCPQEGRHTSMTKGGNSQKHGLVVIAKHLCGAGTDLALRSLRDVSPQVDACVMATCCHGVCTWDDYVGRDHICHLIQEDDDSISFGRAEFELMRRWTSGTVAVDCSCPKDGEAEPSHQNASGTSPTAGNEDLDMEHSMGKADDFKDTCSASSIVQALGLSCGVQGLGRACQRLLDFGRCEYLQKKIFAQESVVELCHYVPMDVTPQNALIIVHRKVAGEA